MKEGNKMKDLEKMQALVNYYQQWMDDHELEPSCYGVYHDVSDFISEYAECPQYVMAVLNRTKMPEQDLHDLVFATTEGLGFYTVGLFFDDYDQLMDYMLENVKYSGNEPQAFKDDFGGY